MAIRTQSLPFVQQVVMLKNPPIDKIGAVALLERAMRRAEKSDKFLAPLRFWAKKECPEDQIEKWVRAGIIPIDLGKEKYNRVEGIGSATEFVAEKFGIELSYGEGRLIELLGRNNKTGHLKGQYFAAAWIIRELYESTNEDPAEIIRRTSHMIHMWIVMQESSPVEGRTVESLREHFPDLAELTAKCNFADFTAGRYLRDLWLSGDFTDEEIRAFVEWWIEADERVRKQIARAEEELKHMPRNIGGRCYEFRVYSANLRCLYLATSGAALTKVAARQYDLLVVNDDGHVSVMARGFDVSKLAAALMELEPGLWYHQPGTGNVINGGRIYKDDPRTGIPWADFMALLKRYPPQRGGQRR